VQKERMSAPKREGKGGVISGHGLPSTQIQNFAFHICWATGAALPPRNSCTIARLGLWGDLRLPRTHTAHIFRQSRKHLEREADYAMLHKIYAAPSEDEAQRYSPATCIACDLKVISGDPDPNHVSTSFVERQNLSMRMGMRRFTRLTNGFSKKLENHGHAVALYFMHYNFCRVHKTLRVTPAMEAGIADHVWSIEELIALLDCSEKKVA
jgi:hypothetical protein